MNINIRQAEINDVDEMIKLFVDTVTDCCSVDYNNEQLKNWISRGKKKSKWINRINTQNFLVAFIGNQIVGFGSIERGEIIDMLYIHKDFLRKGIASKLLFELEKISQQEHKLQICSNVSITARPFFEKNGYKVIKEQKNMINDVEIINFKMIK